MPALKRKAERTVTITIRIPTSTKDELDKLRPIADKQGFDVNLSLTDAVVRCAKQIADELASVHKSDPDLYTNRAQNGRPNTDRAQGEYSANK